MPGEILEPGGGLELGGAQLQLVRVISAAPGLAGPGDGSDLALSALHDRGHYQSDGGANHDPVERAGGRTGLVAGGVDEVAV